MKKIFVVILIMCIFLQSFNSHIYAAVKNSGAYKCNKYDVTVSDAELFKKKILAKDSSYTSYYGEGSKVTSGSFTTKKRTIKYWSSHGSTAGKVWGDNTDASHTVKSGFKWSGDNLEFVIMSACYQLTGSGSNPRAKYAKAMLGDKAVRVICGYHEKAPKGTGKNPQDKQSMLIKESL